MLTEITIKDRADEFRIAIKGKFGGDYVLDAEANWRSVLSEVHSRRFSVDISGMSGFDVAGRRLLREMYQHGVFFAASTPLSLVFLNEIAARRRGATLMPENSVEASSGEPQTSAQPNKEKPFLAVRAAGSGK